MYRSPRPLSDLFKSALPISTTDRRMGRESVKLLKPRKNMPSDEAVHCNSSATEKFSLSPDPREWGSNIYGDTGEPDDDLHSPDHRDHYSSCAVFSARGIVNLGCLLVVILGLLALFIGYPIATFMNGLGKSATKGAFNFGGINATGQVPSMGNFGLIDLDTPQSVYTKTSWKDGSTEMQLVFSDEFNVDGRSFYPGMPWDDPYWEAVDLQYWETSNLNWYDPSAITTKNGSLVVTLSETPAHGLSYQSGMMSSWNKFCFTGGILEVSVVLPGINNVAGLWPAVWALGNLGRAGYGASLDGLWPYSYDACDVGTLPNQTLNGMPTAATTTGPASSNFALSYLAGQRLSRCTCKGESHPGPVHEDGSYEGRSAPEIDVFEAQVTGDPAFGIVSQSGQWAPFDAGYWWNNASSNYLIQNTSATSLNAYIGGPTQQSTSATTLTNPNCYELTGGQFAVYAFEYKPGFDDGYIAWISDNALAWSINAAGVGADSETQISARPVPQEPMYIIINLAMSYAFGAVDLEHLTFPTSMLVDYVRVYQPRGSVNIGCDPDGFPTEAYINSYAEAYSNPNLTTWVGDYGQTVPKNNLTSTC